MAKRIEDFLEQATLIVASNIMQIPFAIADFKWAMQADTTVNFCGSVAGLTAANNFLIEHKDALIEAVALELLTEYNGRPVPLTQGEALHLYLGKWSGLSGRHTEQMSAALRHWYMVHNVPFKARCKKVPHKGGGMHKQYYISSWAWWVCNGK